MQPYDEYYKKIADDNSIIIIETDEPKRDIDELEKKYDEAYTGYLEALDKYVLDTIYKKVKNETATQLESTALSQYYGIVQLKESEYVEYKYRKQREALDKTYL